ncbi:MAG: outer membrane protein [Hyphomicrobiaceae bacterium]
MRIPTVVAATAAVFSISSSIASAADLNTGLRGSYSSKDVVYAEPVATAPRLYGRIDFSYGRHDTPVLTEAGIDTLTNVGFDDSKSFGGGIGLYFTSNVRGDITYERRFETDVRGSLLHAGATLPGVRDFGLQSDLLLANLYYDFDMRGRFTPYVGVGLGAVRHSTSRSIVESCNCTTGVMEEGETWSVAGALMAGVGMQVMSRVHLDAGYRFLYLGEAKTGVINFEDVNGVPGPQASPGVKVEEMHAHEFRVGMRVDLR